MTISEAHVLVADNQRNEFNGRNLMVNRLPIVCLSGIKYVPANYLNFKSGGF